MHVDITSHSLGGGAVGGEHILCAGLGKVDPTSSLAMNWQISSFWKVKHSLQFFSNSFKLFGFLWRLVIQVVEAKQHFIDVLKQRTTEGIPTGQFQPV